MSPQATKVNAEVKLAADFDTVTKNETVKKTFMAECGASIATTAGVKREQVNVTDVKKGKEELKTMEIVFYDGNPKSQPYSDQSRKYIMYR